MTPLVLVHGFMGASTQWKEQVAAFSSDFDVIAPDLPGFGLNRDLPAINSIAGFAEWVIEDLQRQGIRQYHLLGHSMGGMIAQEIARRDKDKVDHLILYGTGATGILPGRFETIAQSKARARLDGPAATARRIAATWFLYRENAPSFPACATLAELAKADAIDAGLDAMQSWDGANGLSEITCPSLLIWGDGDRTYPWQQTEQLWTGISSASLAVIPGCAHAVHLEKADIFNRIVLDFLTGQ